MKPLMYLLGGAVIILLLPAVLVGITDFRAMDYDEPFNVTTGAADTTADVVLTQNLFDEERAYVTITSNVTADAPVPASYVDNTRTLTVSGLKADTTRRLTIDYKVGQLKSFWAADIATRTWPLFLILGVIGIIVGAVVTAVRQRRGED